MTALGRELLEALAAPEGRQLLVEAAREAVRGELARAVDDTLVDIGEAARITGRTVDAVYKASRRGTFPGVVRVGGRLRFRKADLLRGA